MIPNVIISNILNQLNTKTSDQRVVLLRTGALETNSSSAHSLTFNPDLNLDWLPESKDELVLHLRPTMIGNYKYHFQSIEEKLSHILLNHIGLFNRAGSKSLGAALLEQAHNVLGFSTVTLCTDVEVSLSEDIPVQPYVQDELEGVLNLGQWFEPEDGWDFNKLFEHIDQVTGWEFPLLDIAPNIFDNKDWLKQVEILHRSGGVTPMFNQKMKLSYPIETFTQGSCLDIDMDSLKDELKQSVKGNYSDDQLELMILTEIMLNPALIIHQYWDECDYDERLGFPQMQEYLLNNDYSSPLNQSPNRVYIGVIAALLKFAHGNSEATNELMYYEFNINLMYEGLKDETVNLNDHYCISSSADGAFFNPELHPSASSDIVQLAELVNPEVCSDKKHKDFQQYLNLLELLKHNGEVDPSTIKVSLSNLHMTPSHLDLALKSNGEHREELQKRIQWELNDLAKYDWYCCKTPLALTNNQALGMFVDWASSSSFEEMLDKVRYDLNNNQILNGDIPNQYHPMLKRFYDCLQECCPQWLSKMELKHIRPHILHQW